jgi:60 kDa SS-A/Ro ribonucleoprotein
MPSTFPDAGGTHQLAGNAQLVAFLSILGKCDPEFVAKLAVYARHSGKMKDAPLVAALSLLKRDGAQDVGERVFPFVIDNPVQWRNAGAVVMSGLFGTRSFGSRVSRVFNERLFGFGLNYLAARGLVGNDPSLGDVIRMTHPSAKTQGDKRANWEAFFKYILGREGVDVDALPQSVQDYERFKKDPTSGEIPKGIEILQVMGMLPTDGSAPQAWSKLAKRMSWTQLFKNIATLARHKAFEDAETLDYVCGVLRDKEKILKSRQFPYAVYNAYRHLAGAPTSHWRGRGLGSGTPLAPHEALEALQDVLDIAAVENAPKLDATVAIGIDTSGSMFSPVTGHRKGATTTATLVDVAALFGASAYKQNPLSLILPFDDVAKRISLNARDSVSTITDKIVQGGGGGTNVADVFQKTLDEVRKNKNFRPDAILLLSDMQTWREGQGLQSWGWGGTRGTDANQTYEVIKQETGKPVKLVCWNLSAGETTQAKGDTVLNLGGWSEALWRTVVDFLCGDNVATEKGTKVSQEANAQVWLDEIDSIDLSPDALKSRFGK